MSYQKAMREQLGRLSVDMRAICDKAKAEGNRGLTHEEVTRFQKMEADYSALEESIKIAEKTDSIADQLSRSDPATVINGASMDQLRDEFRTTPRVQRERHKSQHDRVFSKYIRNGMGALDSDERNLMQFIPNGSGAGIQNTMSTTTGSQGGYLIPQGFSEMLEEAKKWFGGIDGIVGKFETETGNPFPWPTINDTTNKGRIIGQNVQVTETDFAFGQVMFNAYIGSSDLVLIPLALIQDSFFDLDALTARLLGTRLGRLFNNKCTVGTGSSEPTGIVTAAVAAGNINQFPSGETASITYNDLVNTEHAVDPAYRYDASTRFMFSDAMLKLLKKLVDGQSRPLWQPGLTSSFREGAGVQAGQGGVQTPGGGPMPSILGYPYIVNQDMAAPGTSGSPVTGNYSLLFGALNTFKVRQVSGGTTVLRLAERYADFLQVGFVGYQRFDSQLVDAGTHGIAVGQQSNS
jgi:HK97 family phage major capsid protein